MNFPFIELTHIWNLLQVVLAMVLGAIIGFEREIADKPAGLRTHMLVAGSASLLVLLGNRVVEQFGQRFGVEFVNADPVRIIAAVVTGVSFLGAGTIIRQASRRYVEGLTTAASLLMASAVGIAAALEEWLLAVGTTLLVLIILRILPILEQAVGLAANKGKRSSKIGE
jgi:putative Mg2+ transporter-C (MgtC) family protein